MDTGWPVSIKNAVGRSLGETTTIFVRIGGGLTYTSLGSSLTASANSVCNHSILQGATGSMRAIPFEDSTNGDDVNGDGHAGFFFDGGLTSGGPVISKESGDSEVSNLFTWVGEVAGA